MSTSANEALVTYRPEPATGYAQQLETLRSAARWLLAAFAAVAGALAAGLQLANIGQLTPHSWRLYAALAATFVALGAAGFMIKEASAVLTHESLTLADFTGDGLNERLRGPQMDRTRVEEIEKIQDKIGRSRHELFGYAAETIGQLHRQLREADERGWRDRDGARLLEKDALARRAARDVVQYANYYATLHLFKRMIRRLAWCAAVVAICSGVFAYSTNPPKHDQTTKVQVSISR